VTQDEKFKVSSLKFRQHHHQLHNTITKKLIISLTHKNYENNKEKSYIKIGLNEFSSLNPPPSIYTVIN
jgi:hypothetical protein